MRELVQLKERLRSLPQSEVVSDGSKQEREKYIYILCISIYISTI
jgi:hypothetical protein